MPDKERCFSELGYKTAAAERGFYLPLMAVDDNPIVREAAAAYFAHRLNPDSQKLGAVPRTESCIIEALLRCRGDLLHFIEMLAFLKESLLRSRTRRGFGVYVGLNKA